MGSNKLKVTRNALLGALAGLAIAGLSACGSGSGTSSSADTAATIPAAKKLSRNGRWFTDEQGRVVVIHGTNMINKLPPYKPEALGFGEKDLRFLAENGFNGIRLGFSWAGVEPEPGQYDDAYIDHIVALAAAAARHGMLPVVNFHQDGYSEKYGGNGAPDWANIDFGVPGSPLPPPANVLPGAAVANENFWLNAAAPDGIGLQDHYAAAWKHVAERFRNDPHTVFELYNEPSPGIVDVAVCPLSTGCPEFDIGKLAPFNLKVLQAVRQVDPARLTFVEPNAFFGLGSARTWLPATGDPQVGFAFHNYCALGLVPLPLPAATCELLTNLTLSNAQDHFDRTGEALLMNEFGAFNTDEVVAALLDRSDEMMLSWMHWAYWAQDFGEEATYGLVNDPAEAPEGDNVKQGLLTVLTRPSPRVVAGTPQGWRWDASASTFEARYSTARADGSGDFPAGASSDFFIHPRFFPAGYQVQVSGGKVTSSRNAQRLSIAALPGADEVTLSVTPAAAN
ncbi:MAG TPA: cellulase family glycosylhydrolase [Solimonas sp.]|nr:cellulase family glycosylhydrolase [Solimonas sp.]